MSQSAQDLTHDFQKRGFDSLLGQLIQKIIIIDPILQLYANGELDTLVFRLNSGRSITVKPKDVVDLSNLKPEDLELKFEGED